MTAEGKPARADAARNRRALLDAAVRVFAEEGIDAPLDLIARRAGVGDATLYRHFRSRGELISAALEEQVSRYLAAVSAASRAPDPVAGLHECIRTASISQAGNLGAAELLAGADIGDARIEQIRREIRRDLTAIIEAAQETGRLRPDFTPEDVKLILLANIGVIRALGPAGARASARLIALVTDGLSAAATPAPPPLTERALTAALRRAAHQRRNH